jgi:glutamine cyclotransferase
MKLTAFRRSSVTLLFVTALAAIVPGQSADPIRGTLPPEYTFKVVRTFPHDTSAFTQGLEYRDGFLYESTGLNGRSTLRKVRLETGDVVQRIDLAPELFGEGITIYKDEVIQLTWRSHMGFVYDLNDLRLLRHFSYSGEGWGLATDSRRIFMSDGTPSIRVLDPNTLEERRHFTVEDRGVRIERLNELEFVGGEIFANVWQTDRIARIEPQTGKVVGWIDLRGLLSPIYRLGDDAVLNGIAYDPIGKRLFVTGKMWPMIFQITLTPKHVE